MQPSDIDVPVYWQKKKPHSGERARPAATKPEISREILRQKRLRITIASRASHSRFHRSEGSRNYVIKNEHYFRASLSCSTSFREWRCRREPKSSSRIRMSSDSGLEVVTWSR